MKLGRFTYFLSAIIIAALAIGVPSNYADAKAKAKAKTTKTTTSSHPLQNQRAALRRHQAAPPPRERRAAE